MDLSNQEQNVKEETTNTLSEILSSINLETNSNTNILNNSEEESNKILSNGININLEQTQEISQIKIQEESQIQTENLTTQVQLLTDVIDRRIGDYLLNELEKKNSYIEQLEEAVKFQEIEIRDLKTKLEGLNKLELLSKIKSNMETKLVELDENISSINEVQEQITKPKVVQINKSSQQTQQTIVNEVKKVKKVDEEETQYPTSNPDLVFKSDPGKKVKSIPKEEEEIRYNGVILLEKPKEEQQINIQLDYETETADNLSTMSDVIKQRRRARKL